MIRRNPTLIPMTDLDVQDIRNMVAKQKEQAKALREVRRVAESPNIEQADLLIFKNIKAAQAQREEKDKRLGLTW